MITINHNSIATVGDLIAALDRYDPATPLRCATQPGYPMEHTLARIVSTPDDGITVTGLPVVWLGVGDQVGYLSATAVTELGWS